MSIETGVRAVVVSPSRLPHYFGTLSAYRTYKDVLWPRTCSDLRAEQPEPRRCVRLIFLLSTNGTENVVGLGSTAMMIGNDAPDSLPIIFIKIPCSLFGPVCPFALVLVIIALRRPVAVLMVSHVQPGELVLDEGSLTFLLQNPQCK